MKQSKYNDNNKITQHKLIQTIFLQLMKEYEWVFQYMDYFLIKEIHIFNVEIN